jgi:hypothetical protein
MRSRCLIPLAAVVLASAAGAQVAEIFSKHVSVFQPQGPFAQQLIKTTPGSGDDWRPVDDRRTGYRIMIPESAEVDPKPSGNRVLQVVLAGGPQKPAPIFRVDAFTPEEDDPTEITEKYAADYAENYPELAFNGKFTVSDSGMVVVPRKKLKTTLALVGGSYLQGAVPCYRVQCTYLSKAKQIFFTFDCPEKDWVRHSPTLAAMLLSLEVDGEKKK